MRSNLLVCSVLGLPVAGCVCQSASVHPGIAPGNKGSPTVASAPALRTPKSVQDEHREIHASLIEATRASGRVGSAARALADVLHPHFVREEEIALPPLGLLAPLSAREELPAAVVAQARTMTDSLREELPRMLQEHERIRAAVEALRVAAREEQAPEFERLAEQLALHARTEEEVLYPAALLVGEFLQRR